MRDVVVSMMRFSGAATMFGMEQVQNAMTAPGDTHAAIVRLCATLDSMSDTLASKLDASKKSALDSMSKAQIDILESTSNVVNRNAVSVDTAADFMKRTSESLCDMMAASANGKPAGGPA